VLGVECSSSGVYCTGKVQLKWRKCSWMHNVSVRILKPVHKEGEEEDGMQNLEIGNEYKYIDSRYK
jgi:hypothetical protein